MTGVNVLVETESLSFLFDCGLEQREDYFARSNAAPFPYDPSSVGALFI